MTERKPRLTRALLLKNASDLFRTKGYHRTSIQDIADACQLTKASIYHHISSKEALALDLIRELRQQYQTTIFPISWDPKLTRPQRMTQYLQRLADYYQEEGQSCMLKKFLGELTPADGSLWEEVKAFADDSINAIINVLPEEPKEEIRAQAIRIFTLIQGYLLLNKVWPAENTLEAINRLCQNLYYPVDVEIS